MKYEKPKAEIVEFTQDDIVTVSVGDDVTENPNWIEGM